MLKRIIFYLIASAILTAWGTGWGADYYITQAGSGTNGGLTYENSDSIETFNTGASPYDDLDNDTVYLCDTITTAVLMPDSGTSGNVITVRGNYTGHECTMNGAGTAQNMFRLNQKDYITIDSITFASVDSYVSRAGGAIGDYTGNRTHYSTNITIQNCTFTECEVAISAYNHSGGTGSDYWTITNNAINGAAESIGIIIYGPSNATISNNTIDYVRCGIVIAEASHDITISGNTITRYGVGSVDSQKFGISITGNDGDGTCGDNFTITNNTVRNPLVNADAYELAWWGSPTTVNISNNQYYHDGSAYGDCGIVVDMFTGGTATISGNYVENAQCVGMFILGGTGHTIKGNYLKNCGDECYNGDGENYEYGMGIVSDYWTTPNPDIDVIVSSATVSYNVFDGCQNPIYLIEDLNGEGTPTGNKFYNNTIAGATGTFIFKAYGTNTSTAIKNNILSNTSATTFIYMGADSQTGFTASNNIYYGSGNWKWGASTYTDIADWRTNSGDTTTLTSDPTFVNAAASNFHLAVGSPAIDAGTDVSLTEDYDGRAVPYGAGVDMGALEWVRYVLIQKAE